MSSAARCGTRCRAMSLVLAGLAGGLFGAGLLLSGMTQPAKVIRFLDPVHGWDPSLAFVMVGAVTVYAILFRAIRRHRGGPWLDVNFHLPTRSDLDRPLILGAALFGIGWGLGGMCPGPGIVAASTGSLAGVAFVAAMLAGMFVQERLTNR